MGFPSGYTQVLLPNPMITVHSLLGLIRRLMITLLLHPLDQPGPTTEPDPARTEPESVSGALIREMNPATRFGDLTAGQQEGAEKCTVCLYEFEGGDEIRRLRSCQHIFHRECVDRWIDHDRKTCPLCRKCLVPEELQEAFNQQLWAASGILDFYSEYSLITSTL